MTTQYWVGDFYIDLSRNQITYKSQSRTLPPKALAVLTFLAKHNHQVVSSDEILQEVWIDTVVTPNTLQRSIAQLRKVFAETGHGETYIKTHAKQGYSLECDVRWQKRDEHKPVATSPPKVWSKTPVFIALVISVIVVTIIGILQQSTNQPFELNITEINTLTATDKKEYAGIYSVDGEYIVFQRYSEEVCNLNRIWAKNINTQQESLLTEEFGAYGIQSFSPDGEKLVFIESENCDKPISQNQCYNLMTIDFHEALSTPQKPTSILECKNTRIARPAWMKNNDIVFRQQVSNRWQLVSYSIEENTSSVLYELEEGNVLDYDYSLIRDRIAVNSIHSDGKQYIEILTAKGELLSSQRIKLPNDFPEFKFIYPNFTPFDNQLIFSTGRQLYTLSYEGDISKVSLPLDEPMSAPTFHSDSNRMLVIKGIYDSDIAQIPLSELSVFEMDPQHRQQQTNLEIIQRSNQGEDQAQFQPNGRLIAFESDRSGDEQIWLTDGNSSRMLSNFPVDSYLNEFDWAADGESLLVNVDKQLNRLYLDSKVETIPFQYGIEKLFQWNSVANTALVLARVDGLLTFIQLDLVTAEFEKVNDKLVNWALKTDDGVLIYTDHMNRFWRQGTVEDELITVLENQSMNNFQFITRGNIIYGVNDDFQLWSYDARNHEFQILGKLPQRLDAMTDINASELLVSIRIAAKKEVAELILAND